MVVMSDFVAMRAKAKEYMEQGTPFTVSAYPGPSGVRYTDPVDRRKPPASHFVLYRIHVKPKGKVTDKWGKAPAILKSNESPTKKGNVRCMDCRCGGRGCPGMPPGEEQRMIEQW